MSIRTALALTAGAVALVMTVPAAPLGAVGARPDDNSLAGSWGPVIAVSPLTMKVDGLSLDVAVAADGALTAVWSTRAEVVWARHRSADHVWHDPVRLGPGSWPEAEVAGDGTVTAAWYGQYGRDVWVATATPAGDWATPTKVSEPRPAGTRTRWIGGFELAVAESGAGIVTWVRGDYDTSPNNVEVAYRAPGSTWGKPVTLARYGGEVDPEPSVAINSRGAAVLTWSPSDAYYELSGAFARTRPAHGVWSKRVPLNHGAGASTTIPVIDDAGNITVLWQGDSAVMSVRRPAQSHWTKPSRLAVDGAGPSLGLARSGTVTAVWVSEAGDIVTARRAVGQRWRRPRILAKPTASPSWLMLAVSPTGRAALTWTQGEQVWALLSPVPGQWRKPEKAGHTSNTGWMTVGVAADGSAGFFWPDKTRAKLRWWTAG